ncbi:(2Fe-2S)-binding protein [Orrella sp. JC864]|uniref:(2Fe-2S)-binding protein n=1 Tax=Orrella sp. JC864 TaxID=3120298 RepID=UPI0012BC26AB
MYVCICNAVTERQIHASVEQGATSLADLQFELGVATCCGCCADTAEQYLPGGAACASQPGCPGLCEAAHVEPYQAEAGASAANGYPVVTLVRIRQAA